MARKAIISDIHANLEALTAVEKDMETQKIDEVVCLGDIVGYGPNPIECLDLVRQTCKIVLKGNHELAVLYDDELSQLRDEVKISIRWTRQKISEHERHEEIIAYLKQLPGRVNEGLKGEQAKAEEISDVIYLHGSPRQPITEYLTTWDISNLNLDSLTMPAQKKQEYKEDPAKYLAERSASLQKIAQSFASISRICFNGHTHSPFLMLYVGTDYQKVPQQDSVEKSCIIYKVPRIILPGARQVSVYEVNEGYAYTFPINLHNSRFKLGNEKMVINVGSVGQPRDSDKRACYLIYDDNEFTVEWRRVKYDPRQTAIKIMSIPEIPPESALRLLNGL